MMAIVLIAYPEIHGIIMFLQLSGEYDNSLASWFKPSGYQLQAIKLILRGKAFIILGLMFLSHSHLGGFILGCISSYDMICYRNEISIYMYMSKFSIYIYIYVHVNIYLYIYIYMLETCLAVKGSVPIL